MDLYALWKEDENRFIQETRRFSEQLSETLQAEKNYSIHDADCAWDVDSIHGRSKSENLKKTKNQIKINNFEFRLFLN